MSAHAVALVPERWARRFNVLPLAATAHELLIATADPLDVDCERTIAFASGRDIKLAVADAREIACRVDEVYRGEGSAPPRAPEALVEVQHLRSGDETAPPSAGDDYGASVAALVDELLAAGIAGRASDIHIEPEEQGIAVRHRVDGVLAQVRTLPRAVGPALVSRVKILSGLDIADRLRPQDGRARVAINGVAVDLRVSTLPASHGEKVVVRVLDGRSTVLTLEGMGFHDDELSRIGGLLQAREGLILVTGPTGSGKTTTLYAALRRLKQRGVNIVTVEDPIEYRLPGIVQVQVNEKAGLTFATALRSIMRQDPDVVLIGEIRDRETAEIAIQASLTGHLVLSTLHTNDAPSAVTRLIDIGVASYKIATAVKGVLAQRLVRRLCTACGAAPSSRDSGAAGTTAVGKCRVCGGSGFHGRIAIVEVLDASAEFERRVAAGESTERIADAARAAGMRPLWQSGLAHVARGRTTVDEVLRVATRDDSAAANSANCRETGADAHDHPVTEASRACFEGPAFELREDLDARSTAYPRRVGEAAPRAVTLAAPAAPAAQGLSRDRARTSPAASSLRHMTKIEVGTVDVFVIRALSDGWRVLALQRRVGTRCPLAWEPVHGHIEDGETPEDAAIREVREESSLAIERLYVVRVQPFYLRKIGAVELAIVFAAFVGNDGDVALGDEHAASAWLTVDEALERFAFPGERASLREIVELLHTGDAGPVDDVMRVR